MTHRPARSEFDANLSLQAATRHRQTPQALRPMPRHANLDWLAVVLVVLMGAAFGAAAALFALHFVGG